jgi:hypothetical protein
MSLDLAADLVVKHRAIGKVGTVAATAGVRASSTDFTNEDQAYAYGAQLVRNGNWTEFYVKTIITRAR